MKIVPNLLEMESETVLTQHIIKNWTLAYIKPDWPLQRNQDDNCAKKKSDEAAVLTIYLPTILVLSYRLRY